jgi:probable rRNA maturation factor
MNEIEVIVNAGDFPDVDDALLERAVRHALIDARAGGGEVSITLLDDAGIRDMNREYLDRDRTTDVIAFSLDEESLMGDVYLGFDQATRQSAELGIALNDELTRLAIHGTLHVLGHDHPDGVDRTESLMFRLQERLLAEVLAI